MISNHLKTALKNLSSRKLYAAINVLGLAVGLACCLLISLFVRHELSYDNFFVDAAQIYRVSPNFAAGALGPARSPAGNVAPVGPLLAQSGVSGVEGVARIGGMPALISTADMAFTEADFRWADPEIFRIFSFQGLQGEASDALTRPQSVVISERIARKYFGNQDPLGQTLMLENTWLLTVTGVIADLPDNTHLSADLIVPMETAWKLLDFDYGNNWAFTSFHTYLRLQPGAQIDNVMKQVKDIVTASIDNELAGFFGISPATFSQTAYPLMDIHLHSGRQGEFRTPGSMSFVLTFSAVALCLLLIACINFMNLSTARAAIRAKEVGVRKAIGASRTELIRQFLGESFLTTLLALALALVLTETLLPAFSAILERELAFATLAQPGFVLYLTGITVLAALVAGSYPAFYLSAFKPARVFRSSGIQSGKGLAVRNVLVVLQFFLAIALIICTVVIYSQLQFVRALELGFNKEQIVVLSGTQNEGLGAQWSSFRQQLLQHPGVISVAEGDMAPGSAGNRPVRIEGGPAGGIDMRAKQIGFGFFETYDIALLAGRDFDRARSTDVFYPPPNVPDGVAPTGAYVLNVSAVRQLGWTPEEALGKHFEVDFSADFSLTVAGPVIGVVEDVHTDSLREPIEPLVYFVPPEKWGNQSSFAAASVRLAGTNVDETVAYITATWRQFMPEIPLLNRFLDADYAALYRAEERQGQLFSLFALLTVVIACLGLFGLASFTVERRFKEIGVRKVMGGSVSSIVLLLTNDFSKLVLLSNLIAWPVAYVAMERWLQNFAYRIDLTPVVFIGSGLIALCIAWVTVGGTAAKAASAKPVLALRYE